MIQITDLYKYYGTQRAVGPITTTIDQGQIVGLLGLNGAGKTTTLRVLACDLIPTSGTVQVDGIDVVERPEEVRARVGYLPDSPPLYGEMRVVEYLSFVARLRGVPAADVSRRVADVIELTETGRERNKLIAALSHGFKQRVGIAQAIVHRPKLVVLDEPISGLDPKQIVDMRALVRSLRGEHTVVISSHILTEISETCDRILVIRDGAIAAEGTEADLFTQMQQSTRRVDVTVRQSGASTHEVFERLERAARGVDGVTEVEEANPSEAGDGVASARVYAGNDVRDALCRALVNADLGVLALARSEHELENVFLELSGATSDGERRSPREGSSSSESAGNGASQEASA